MTTARPNVTPGKDKAGFGGLIGRLTSFREFFLLATILVIGVLMTFLSPYFLRAANLSALLLGLSVEGTITIGMVILLISGVFDLSVGSTLAWSGVAAALAMAARIPVPLALLIGLVAAGLVGLTNGLIVSKLKINAFMTTLATTIIVRGVLLLAAGGSGIPNLPAAFNVIGQGKIGLIQYPVIVFLVIALIFDILLRKNRFFRQNYYIGANEKAAVMTGINVDLVRTVDFIIVALLAGISGLMLTARFGSASVTVGSGMELRVIAAAVVGGCSLNGGEGTVLGGVLGSLLMLVIINALNLLGVNVYWQNLVTGLVLLGAVIVDRYSRRG